MHDEDLFLRLLTGLLTILLIFTLIQFIGVTGTASAAPASDQLHTKAQPDGTQFEARQWGSEFNHGWEVKDGYTIIKRTDGWWVYATVDSGEIVPTDHKVGIDGPPDDLSKYLRGDAQTSPELSSDPQPAISSAGLQKSSPDKIPTTGSVNLPVVLINFSDTSTEYAVADFQSLIFGDDPPIATGPGSMKDYYEEASNGQLTLSGGSSGVQGWYTADHGHDYYGQSYTKAAELAREAVRKSDANTDYSQFDNNNDGMVDGIIVIHQGAGEEVTGDSDDIWSHRWYFTSAGLSAYDTDDGVSVNSYSLQPETFRLDKITTVGVITHETGHIFGMGDLYDTDYSSNGIGEWGLMGDGSWNEVNRAGDSPAHPTAYHKWYMGWVSPSKKPLTGPMGSLDPYATTHETFQWRDNPNGVERGGTGEYFLAANRHGTGFDQALPGHGLIITHIDESQSHNTNENNKLVDIEAADGDQDLDNDINQGDTGDPYPGSTDANAFNNTSTPNSYLYGSSPSGLEINEITTRGDSVVLNPTTGASAISSITAPNVSADGATTENYTLALDQPVEADVTLGFSTETGGLTTTDISGITAIDGTPIANADATGLINGNAVVATDSNGEIDLAVMFNSDIDATDRFNASIDATDSNITKSNSSEETFNVDTITASSIAQITAPSVSTDGMPAAENYTVSLDKNVHANITLALTGENLTASNITDVTAHEGTSVTDVDATGLVAGTTVINTSSDGKIDIAIGFNSGVRETDTLNASIDAADPNIDTDDSEEKTFSVDTTGVSSINSISTDDPTATATTAVGNYTATLNESVRANVTIGFTGNNLTTSDIAGVIAVNGTNETVLNSTTLVNGNAVVNTTDQGELDVAVTFDAGINASDTFTASINSSDTNISADDSLSETFFVDTTGASSISSITTNNLTADGTTATGNYTVTLDRSVQATVTLDLSGGTLTASEISRVSVIDGTNLSVTETALVNGIAVANTTGQGKLNVAITFQSGVNTASDFWGEIDSSDSNISADDSANQPFFVDTAGAGDSNGNDGGSGGSGGSGGGGIDGGGGGAQIDQGPPSIAEIENTLSSFVSPTTTAKPELEDGETDSPKVTVTPVETRLVNRITFNTKGISGSVDITEYADPPGVMRERMSESMSSTDAINVGSEDTDSGDSIDVVAVANITPTTEEAEESAATVRLRVDKSKVGNPEQLSIIKEFYDFGAQKTRWKRLNTTVEDTGSDTVTISAQVEDFSLFAVTEIQQQRLAGGEVQQRQAVQQQSEQQQNEQQQNEQQQNKNTAPLLRLLASGVVLLSIFAAAGFYIRRNYTGVLKEVSMTDIVFWRDNDSTEITADEFD
jgi:M6 family metalloprotease-like protein